MSAETKDKPLRELVVEMHTDMKHLAKSKDDHEKRIRTVEKGMWGILATSLAGVGAFVKSIFIGS